MAHFLAMEEQTFIKMKYQMTTILKVLKALKLKLKSISKLNPQFVIKGSSGVGLSRSTRNSLRL